MSLYCGNRYFYSIDTHNPHFTVRVPTPAWRIPRERRVPRETDAADGTFLRGRATRFHRERKGTQRRIPREREDSIQNITARTFLRERLLARLIALAKTRKAVVLRKVRYQPRGETTRFTCASYLR